MFLKCSHLAMVDICDYILIYSMAYMLQTILFGPGSLDGRWKPLKSMVRYLWGVKSVTPGLIALVAVLVSVTGVMRV